MTLRMTDFQLTEIIKKTVNSILKEELDINDAVDKMNDEIRRKIISEWRGLPRENVRDGLTKSCGSFEYDIFGTVFTVNYTVFNYRDEYAAMSGGEKYGANVKIIDKVIELSVVAISGYIDERYLSGSLQHEIEHWFQRKNSGKPLLAKSKVYDLAVENLGSNGHNGWDGTLANVIYYSRNEEQDAFVNGLYGTLKNMAYGYDFKDLIEKSEIFRAIGFMNAVGKEMREHFYDDDFKDACEMVYGKKRRWFIGQAKTAEWKIAEKLNKIIKKAKKERIISPNYFLPHINEWYTPMWRIKKKTEI